MKRLLLFTPLLLLTLSGCNWEVLKNSNLNFNLNAENTNTSNGADWDLASSLNTFSEDEFNTYVAAMQDAYAEKNKPKSSGLFDDLVLSDATVETSGLAALGESEATDSGSDEQITNVQEQGVDEGDIVKAHGDYLVVLSRGRVFTVRIKENGVPLLKPVFRGPAYAEGFTNGTWYDEMLIQDDMIVVIGYSYTESATQVGLFSFNDDNGSIAHQRTFFIDSNDYYSSRNYASRLVDGKLVFYMPYYLFDSYYYSYDDDERLPYQFPQIREWIRGNETTAGRDLLEITDIYKPVQDSSSPTLHTVLSCDLTQPTVDCSGKAVLGPYSRTFYVSPTTVYLWVSESYYGSTSNEPDAYVYAMPLDGSGAGVVRAYGTPLDQFSFKESDDGYLNVLVQETGIGDAMWGAEYSDSDIALVRFSLSMFAKEPSIIDKPYYQPLVTPTGYTIQNRFVGDHLLYGSSTYDYYYDYYNETNDSRGPNETNVVYVKNYKRTDSVQKVNLVSGVERIEVLNNENAVVVGGREDDLVFSWVNLNDPESTVVDTYTVYDANQGESRSHGFFYSSSMNMLGLPIRKFDSSGYDYLYDESIEVVYLSLDNNHFTGLGSLKNSTSDREFNDNCEFSCVDWYGNSRPIFYQDRIFALMGYELVEGQRDGSALEEINRTNVYSYDKVR